MTSIFLRFPSETVAVSCMKGWYSQGWSAPNGMSIDVIGTIPGAVGFHINVIGELPEKAKGFAVEPKNPYRVFA